MSHNSECQGAYKGNETQKSRVSDNSTGSSVPSHCSSERAAGNEVKCGIGFPRSTNTTTARFSPAYTANGSFSSHKDIGHNSSRHCGNSGGQYKNHGHNKQHNQQLYRHRGHQQLECVSDDNEEYDSCDSCSDLTEEYNRRQWPSVLSIRDPVKTFRPCVRFQLLAGTGKMDRDNDLCNSKAEISLDLNRLSRKGTGSVRYVQPRLSLLGKPIAFKMHRRDARYRRLQARVYNFLERPKDLLSVLYHIGM